MRPERNAFYSIIIALGIFLLFSAETASGKFTEVTSKVGLTDPQFGRGYAIADYDGDEKLDIYVVNQGDNLLYRFENGVTPFFENIAAQAGVLANSSTQALGAASLDYNNDGLPDILTYNPPTLFKNSGNGQFEDVTLATNVKANAKVTACALGDYNQDGYPDIYLVLDSATQGNILLKNSGPPNWRFLDRGSVARVHSRAKGTGAIFFDYNLDGFQDIYVINKNSANHLYENQGDSTFVNVAAAKGVAFSNLFTGVTAADYDNDGDFDLYLTVSGAPNLLLKNSGFPDFNFSNAAEAAGVAKISNGYTAAFGDYDNDGWLDIYASSSFQTDALFRNNGNGTFENVADTEGLEIASGEMPGFIDYNQDGHLDLFTLNVAGPNHLFQGTDNQRNWLQIRLEGTVANRQALGAKIRLYANNQWQLREINGTSAGAFASHFQPEHFGLNGAHSVDSLVIEWPGGASTDFSQLPGNQLITIREDEQLPSAPHLVQPENRRFINQSQPILQWSAFPDSNGDSLHFSLEIARDSDFNAGLQTFNSYEDTTGFLTGLPVADPTENIQFQFPAPLADGKYWWRVRAYDGVGFSPFSPKFQFTVDTVLPENPVKCTDLRGSTTARWQNITNSPRFFLESLISLDSLQFAGFLYYWGANPSGESTNYHDSTIISLPSVADGEYFFRIRTQDLAGNLAADWQTLFIFKYDGTPPTGARAMSVAISDTETFFIRWENTASDQGGSGLSGHYLFRVQQDDSAWQSPPRDVFGPGIFYTGQSGHKYGFEITAKDSAGNVELFSNIPETQTLIDTTALDNYPPPAPRNLTANAASPSPWQNQPEFTLRWENPYDRSRISRYLYKTGAAPVSNADTTGSDPVQQPLRLTISAEDGVWCHLWLEDGRGNQDYRQRDSVLLRFDQTLPFIQFSSLREADFGGSWYNPKVNDSLTIKISYHEKHPRNIKISLHDEIYTTQPGSLTSGMGTLNHTIHFNDLADGTQLLNISLQDSAANRQDTTFTFSLDQTAPTGAQAFSPQTANSDSFKVSWYGTAGDNPDGAGVSGIYEVHYRVNDGGWRTWLNRYPGESKIFHGVQGERYAFEAAAYDNVGNRESFLNIAESTTLVDTTQQLSPVPPERVELIAPENFTYVNRQQVRLSWKIPADLNADSLHFKIEIALDSLFQTGLQSFESSTDPNGFTPQPPVLLTDSTMNYQLPASLPDTIYWWRVSGWDGVYYGQFSQSSIFTRDTQSPINPTICIDSKGTLNNRWQNQSDTPRFTWQGAADERSGLAGYVLYWGEDSLGEAAHFTGTNTFSPGPVSSGHRFLRVRSRDNAGNMAAEWTTLFNFKYDGIAPFGTVAGAPPMSDGPTFTITWANTATDSGGSRLTGFYDVRMEKDTSGNWIPWLEKQQLDSIQFTGEIGHYYSFEAAAWDSADNREPFLGQAESVTLCAPENQPPEPPVLLAPNHKLFIASLTGQFKWLVPVDADFNQLNFKIEFSTDSTFQNIRHKFESKKDTVGFVQSVAMDPGIGSAAFIFPKHLADGIYWWHVSAWDGWVYGAPSLPFQFILDSTPPDITHSVVEKTDAGTATPISFTPGDAFSGVAHNRIIYRIGGQRDSTVIEADRFSIPADAATSRGLEYALASIDYLGNYRRVPAVGFFNISVFVGGEGEIKPNLHPFGEGAAAYRMLAVPLALENASPKAVLGDDLGGYDRKLWRLFDYVDEQFWEFQNITDGFLSGKAFWLISRYAIKQIDSGPGYSVRTTEPFRIPLDSTTWTMIGNPFNFSIPVENLQLENGRPLTNLITYDRYWKLSPEIEQLEPWEGYMIKPTESTALIIHPVAAKLENPPKNIVSSNATWEVAIEAQCGEARDLANYVGVSDQAETEWDELDLFEPPTISEYITVRFPHHNWQHNPDNYTTDYRAKSEAGYFWDFEIETNYENQPVEVKFSAHDSIPANFQRQLVQRNFNFIHDLEISPVVNFVSGYPETVHRFRLIIGTDEFVSQHDLGAGQLPDQFTLYQNYPNPFNSTTMIRFFLPAQDVVSLKIFNILGQNVCDLIPGENQKAGFYELHWNGLDQNGLPVASGLYFYRINCKQSGFSKMIKMVLAK